MSKYEYVNVLERASIEDYILLFEKSYGAKSKLTAKYLRWLYQENPHGTAVGIDAFLDGKLAAHYVTIPRLYRVSGELIPAVLSVNTATHPDHQRRGLFTKLASATYERAEKQGYQFVVGVANAQSIHGFVKKLSFQHLGQINLALWRQPVSATKDLAALDQCENWIRWRLANPSSDYFLTPAKKNRETVIVNCRRSGLVFSLGSTKRSLLPQGTVASRLVWKSLRGPNTLTPLYPNCRSGLVLPECFMPSPWHLIIRQLGPRATTMFKIHFDGLSMDTF